jgi:hypothetical protein
LSFCAFAIAMVYTYTLQEYHLVHVFVILLHLFSAWMMGLNGAIIVDGI